MGRSLPTWKHRYPGKLTQGPVTVRRERTVFEIAVASLAISHAAKGKTINPKKLRKLARKLPSSEANTHEGLNKIGIQRHKDGNRLGLRKRLLLAF